MALGIFFQSRDVHNITYVGFYIYCSGVGEGCVRDELDGRRVHVGRQHLRSRENI